MTRRTLLLAPFARQTTPAPVRLEDAYASGDLLRRSQMLFRRLHDDPFAFDALRKTSMPDAPGDALGRTILGLTLLCRGLHRDTGRVHDIVRGLPSTMNERGYIGQALGAGAADEGQLAGHNGLLRGLCEYHLWTGDAQAKRHIENIARNLLAPVAGLFASYPLLPSEERRRRAAAIGQSVDAAGAWRGLNSDIAQVFMVLDGATQAYSIVPSPELKTAIESLIAQFARLDMAAAGAQTHSMLTTIRGLLRFYEQTQDRRHLSLAEERFRIYNAQATTENYANQNWFHRPSWTEPCAVVDAFTIALWLWRLTAAAEWLDYAHAVYWNALAASQRPNGGFGCDQCIVPSKTTFLKPYDRIFEAPWCCTMRGAEGLAEAMQHTVCVAGETVTLPIYFSGVFHAAGSRIRVSTEYPEDGRVRVSLLSGPAAKRTFRFFVPSWYDQPVLQMRYLGHRIDAPVKSRFAALEAMLKPGDEVTFDLAPRLHIATARLFPGSGTLRFGLLLLGREGTAPAGLPRVEAIEQTGAARFVHKPTGDVLEPLYARCLLPESAALTDSRQVVF